MRLSVAPGDDCVVWLRLLSDMLLLFKKERLLNSQHLCCCCAASRVMVTTLLSHGFVLFLHLTYALSFAVTPFAQPATL